MRVLILGAGVVGLTTAWALADDGHEVHVIDCGDGPATGASHANGAQLSYSYVAPLATPSLLAKLPQLMMLRSSPLRFHPQFDTDLWRWCLRFLAACTARQMSKTTELLLRLSYYSRAVMDEIISREAISFDQSSIGKLVVYSDVNSLAEARAQVLRQQAFGSDQHVLETEGCLEVEPALVHIRNRIAGGVFTPSDSVGDCLLFCEELANRIVRRSPSSTLDFGSRVIELIRRGGRVVGVESDRGRQYADAVVLAFGTGSRALARKAGFDLPIYPLKGYSLTLTLSPPSSAPNVSVTDSARKTVYARIGSRLRVAGMVDFDGYNVSIDRKRVDLLVRDASQTFPEAGDFSNAIPWAGLRPATPRGIPILGRSPVPGLFLNVGHGPLGFTLAAGCARAVAEVIQGRETAISLDGLTLNL